jgi:hypothetical protein
VRQLKFQNIKAVTPRNSKSHGVWPNILVKLAPAKPTEVFNSYWHFAAERQKVFFKRIANEPPPWTEDEILQSYKFTNAYRASDRVSQYLIRCILYDKQRSPDDIFFRCLLFKFFNKIETWKLLETEIGEIRADTFDERAYERVLTKAMREKTRIYSAAYIMPSGGSWTKCVYKHQMHLKLIRKMLDDRLWEKLASAPSMGKAFELLRSYPTIGDFLAYQYITDLNYSTLTDFTEMEFVVPGPGAKHGINKCFESIGGLTESEIIRYVTDCQEFFFDQLGLSFQNLWGRRLQLIDCQNLFCEIDKYARVRFPEYSEATGRTRIKQAYKRSQPLPKPFYPPKWGLKINPNAEVLIG